LWTTSFRIRASGIDYSVFSVAMAGRGRDRQPAGQPVYPNPGASDVEQLKRHIEFLTQRVAKRISV
jgi:hypothetical protein